MSSESHYGRLVLLEGRGSLGLLETVCDLVKNLNLNPLVATGFATFAKARPLDLADP